VAVGITDGVLRQYFPKGTNLARHSRADVDAVASISSCACCSNPRERGLFGDGSLGATAIRTDAPVVTADKTFGAVLRTVGVEVRVP